MSPDGNSIGGTELESWLPQTEPPTLAPVDKQLSLREEAQESSYTAACDQEPPVLSISKAASNSGKEVERQTDKETAVSSDGNSICGSELESWTPQTEQPTLVPVDKQLSLREEAQEYSSDEQLSALEEMEEDGVVSDATLVHLIAPQHLKQSLHPVVLLKNTNKSEGYHCAKFKDLYRHQREHTGITPFKCGGCGLYYSQSSSLNRHKRPDNTCTMLNDSENGKDAGPSPFSCRFCGKTFLESDSLAKHMPLHSGDRPYQCQECGKKFIRRSHLAAHKNVHQRRIQCTVCKKILPTISELIRHRQTHTKRGMLQCPDCPMQFKYPAFLLRHLRSHKQQASLLPKQEKQHQEFQCSLCRMGFGSCRELSIHYLKHIPKRSVNQCPICKRHFCSRAALVRHVRLHTGEKPFGCQACEKRFSRKETLRAHQEKCSETQPESAPPKNVESIDVTSCDT
ncbi:hypothetical protein JZ751_007399 [Albula glossodonta]|uniref:C2H2-type domain-containing protein n=1 Tax=Albula glossodonta TaxID=121402 RepID=A0A8T2N9U0_9TELE|nr:hypothetical protein JZ751_007399 [Albula glossodonta]